MELLVLGTIVLIAAIVFVPLILIVFALKALFWIITLPFRLLFSIVFLPLLLLKWAIVAIVGVLLVPLFLTGAGIAVAGLAIAVIVMLAPVLIVVAGIWLLVKLVAAVVPA